MKDCSELQTDGATTLKWHITTFHGTFFLYFLLKRCKQTIESWQK